MTAETSDEQGSRAISIAAAAASLEQKEKVEKDDPSKNYPIYIYIL